MVGVIPAAAVEPAGVVTPDPAQYQEFQAEVYQSQQYQTPPMTVPTSTPVVNGDYASEAFQTDGLANGNYDGPVDG